ncbi:THUMP domain-containing protein 1 homolog [Arctopsyche grandis]|uniref:THUMP domain-containing protein 1 homolog n=1 Tax=Arctopsyche grandis TaxID=121162 RepID=UPI00406D8D48
MEERGRRGGGWGGGRGRGGGGGRGAGGQRRGGGGGWWGAGKKRHFQQLEVGARGFFCTCNFQEKNCIKEAYNLLNEFAPADPAVNQTATPNPTPTPTPTSIPAPKVDDECEDPSEMLHQQIAEIKAEEHRPKRFYSLTTNVNNCIFIQANVEDPVVLGHTIAKHIADTKIQKSRFLLRLVPIEVTCSVTLTDIINSAGKLFDKHFLCEPTTFSIVFNRRYNNSVSRDIIIKELADLVTSKNCNHKADLTNPKLAIIVEVLKGVCMMSVLPDYHKLKKYNLIELCSSPDKDNANKQANDDSVTITDKDAPVIDKIIPIVDEDIPVPADDNIPITTNVEENDAEKLAANETPAC